MNVKDYLNWKKLIKNKSLKNVMVLTSGTVLSQVLPILFFPILSRLYTPADYGVLGLFMSISMLLMLISNLQLNYAILIPKEDKEALKVLMTGLHLIIFFTVISLLLVIAFGGGITQLLSSSELKPWLYLLPATVLFSGANIQLSAWFNRTGQFNVISSSRVTTSLVTVFFSLTFSQVIIGSGGLLISYFLGSLSSFFILFINFKKRQSIFPISYKELIQVVKANKNYPLFTLPTELLNNLTQQLPLYIFSMYSGVQTVGWFSRGRQILGLPINYISGSVSEVYKQKASEAFRNNPSALKPLFFKTLGYLFLFSIVPFLLLGFFSPFLFAFFFGENWRQAGVFTQCLVVMYFFKFVISPLTFNFLLMGKQRINFAFHVITIFLILIALFCGLYLFKSEVLALILFSGVYSIFYLIYGYLSFAFIPNVKSN